MKKILLVDDDETIRSSMMAVLESAYEIKEASSRAQARQTLKSYTPDLAILDVMMETNDAGFELAREIKQNPALSNTKIIMYTSVDSELNIDFKSSAGDPDWLPVDEYLSKPVNPKLLIEAVKKLIGV